MALRKHFRGFYLVWASALSWGKRRSLQCSPHTRFDKPLSQLRGILSPNYFWLYFKDLRSKTNYCFRHHLINCRSLDKLDGKLIKVYTRPQPRKFNYPVQRPCQKLGPRRRSHVIRSNRVIGTRGSRYFVPSPSGVDC